MWTVAAPAYPASPMWAHSVRALGALPAHRVGEGSPEATAPTWLSHLLGATEPMSDTGDAPKGVVVDLDVLAAVRGDRAASTRVLERIAPRIRNLVRYLVRNDPDADDLSQEAFVAVLLGLASFRAEGSFDRFWQRIVLRTVFGNLRTRRTARLRAVPVGDATEDLPEARSQDPRYVTRRKLMTLLDQLPDEQRHVLVAHHVLGMTAPEVAAELNVPLETVRSRLRLGTRKLRESLGMATDGADVEGEGT